MSDSAEDPRGDVRDRLERAFMTHGCVKGLGEWRDADEDESVKLADVAVAALPAHAAREALTDEDADFVTANEKLGEGLTEVGMTLGLPKPRPGATWGVAEVLSMAKELRNLAAAVPAPAAGGKVLPPVDRTPGTGCSHRHPGGAPARHRGAGPTAR